MANEIIAVDSEAGKLDAYNALAEDAMKAAATAKKTRNAAAQAKVSLDAYINEKQLLNTQEGRLMDALRRAQMLM